MLDGERNADNGHEAGDGRHHVANREPDAGKDKPQHIAEHAEHAGADVVALVQFAPADRLLAEREEREAADHKAGLAPRNADDRAEGQQPGEPPRQAHEDTAKHKPEEIADRTHAGIPEK
ncbi:hypothetical protein AWV80_12145 [Cupriavidus sp. UYMU48A]|nr:hypothetical protein AWV80_12145 [Cupriavidus sp. UYMU48A]